MISVVVTLYNGKRYLKECLESVFSQTEQPGEVIVVDDGSTDGGDEIVKEYGSKIVYFRQSNGGVSVARNTGASLSKGDYLAFIDCDDLWTSGKLNKQLLAFQGNPDADMVFGHMQNFYSPEVEEGARQSFVAPMDMRLGYLAGAMLIRRKSYDRAGGFDTGLRLGEFIEWYGRAKDAGLKEVSIPDLVLRRRLHGNGQASFINQAARANYLKAVKETMLRRRGL